MLKLGARSDNYLEVLEGVKEGEQVVTLGQLPDRCREQSEGCRGGSSARPRPVPRSPSNTKTK